MPVRATVLTIAGSDPSGGAGIQADIKAIAANGGYAAAAVSALTVQNTCTVERAEPVDPGLLRAQIRAVLADLNVTAVKTGMLASASSIEVVAELLEAHGPLIYVCDPVLTATTGRTLLPAAALASLQSRLLPLATLVTPNAREAEALAGVSVRGVDDAVAAAEILLQRGVQAVLVKGGHLQYGAATDVLVTREHTQVFHGDWHEARHTHGTGCIFAAAIATQLSHGLPLIEAIAVAKVFVSEAIRAGYAVGHGAGPADPFFFFRPTETAPDWLGRLSHVVEGHP